MPFCDIIYKGLNPGLVGLALTYTVTLSTVFQLCMRHSADVETTVSYQLLCL